MTIPKTLKVGGLTYRIEVTPLESGDCGDFDSLTGVIRINSNLSKEAQEATFIHEIFHSLNSEFSDGPMHAFMDSLSLQWYAVLKENNLLAPSIDKPFAKE